MNANRRPEEDDDLVKLLRQWEIEAPLPRRFQERVWRRIEKADAGVQTMVRQWLQRLLEGIVPRQKFAWAYLSTLLVVGVAAGSVAAQIKTNRTGSALSMRYVQSIDPYRAGTSLP